MLGRLPPPTVQASTHSSQQYDSSCSAQNSGAPVPRQAQEPECWAPHRGVDDSRHHEALAWRQRVSRRQPDLQQACSRERHHTAGKRAHNHADLGDVGLGRHHSLLHLAQRAEHLRVVCGADLHPCQGSVALQPAWRAACPKHDASRAALLGCAAKMSLHQPHRAQPARGAVAVSAVQQTQRTWLASRTARRTVYSVSVAHRPTPSSWTGLSTENTIWSASLSYTLRSCCSQPLRFGCCG